VSPTSIKFQNDEPAPGYPKLAEAGKLKLLDLFCGAGVLSSGLQEAGLVEVCWGVDSDKNCIQSFNKNYPNASGLQMTVDELLHHLKVNNFVKSELLKQYGTDLFSE
jgi:site-specific DNA-cytosine methylase